MLKWLFPHLLDLVMRQKQMTLFRDRIGKAAAGRVLDIGIGSGVIKFVRRLTVLAVYLAVLAVGDGLVVGRLWIGPDYGKRRFFAAEPGYRRLPKKNTAQTATMQSATTSDSPMVIVRPTRRLCGA